MLDTNILVSAIVFRSKHMNEIIRLLSEKHALVLCSYVVDELHEVINDKFPSHAGDVSKFRLELPFELVYTPQELPKHELFKIRDEDDEKVLYSAIIADVDILVTGDKDFYDVEIERPEILSPMVFLEKHS
jgi:putative PIN family toxin of toxin-antitoxin system